MRHRSASRALACVAATLSALLLPPAAGQASAPVPWHLSAIDAPASWAESTGEGVTVAVVDSGVDADHPDLAGAVLPGRSYVDLDPGGEPRLLAVGGEAGPVYERAFGQADPVGHGTAVAGLIAAGADSGHPGVAPDAEILPVRVLDDENRYHDSAMVGAAVEWAVDNGADIVNLSLGGHYDSAPFAEAIAYAEANDVLVVACTGNQRPDEPDEEVWFPARVPDVLAVTGTDAGGDRWRTAVTGEETDLAAPGAALVAAQSGGGHREVTGTSFASALVSGAAALVRSAHPDWTADEVRRAMVATARGGGDGLGAGVVDAAAAVDADVAALPPAEDPPAASPAWGLAATAAGGALLGLAAFALRGSGRAPRRRWTAAGPAGARGAHLGPQGPHAGAQGLSAHGLGAQGLGPHGLGPQGIGPQGLGPQGVRPASGT